MPLLTQKFERVIIHGLQSTDATRYDNIDAIKLLLMVQEIRISEDYCHSDIIIIDFANCTLGHLPKFTLTDVKKYELCVLVSTLVTRNMLIDFPIP